jgi:hypothetical protein
LTLIKKCLRGVALSREHAGKPFKVAVVEELYLYAVVGLDDYDFCPLVEAELST